MEQVKAGAKIDSESGEAINNVEKVLLKNGIALRDNANSFRDMSDVLQDVAVKYKELGASGNTVAQQQIVGAIAGVRQANMLASLLDNWEQVGKAQDVAADSMGLASDRYEIYMQSMEAATNKFQVALQEMWTKTIMVSNIKDIVNIGTSIISVIGNMGGLVPVLTTVIGLLVALNATKISLFFVSVGQSIAKIIPIIMGLGTVLQTTLGWFGLIITAVGIGISLYNAYGNTVENLTKRMEESNQALSDTNAKLDDLNSQTKNIKELSEQYDSLSKNTKKTTEEQQKFTDIQNQLKDILPLISGYYDQTGNFIVDPKALSSNEAYLQLIKDQIDALREKAFYEGKTAASTTSDLYAKNQKEIENVSKLINRGSGGALSGAGGGRYGGVGLSEEDVAIQQSRLQELKANQSKYITDEVARWSTLTKVQQEEMMKQYTNEKEFGKKVLDIINSINISSAELYAKQNSNIAAAEAGIISSPDIVDASTESYDSLLASMNAVTNASKEQNDQGYISNQTAINLIASNADLAQYLTQTANGYIFDADAARQATFIEMQNAFAKHNIADAAVDAANGNYKLAMSAIAASGAAADEQTAMIALLNAFAAMNVSVSVPSGGGGGGVNEAEQAYQDLLDMTIKMLRQKKEAQKEALQQELNAYKDIIDARKKLLDQQRDEKKYQDEIADKNKKISDIENQLLALQFDNSEEAKAKRLKLEEEKAAAIKDLDDTQADHSVETQKDALDNEYDDFKKAIDKKIDAIDKYLSQSGKIAAQAIKLLKEHSDSLFNQLLKWNSVYGSGIQSDVIDKWALAAQAIGNYNSAVGGAIANTVNAINTIQDIIDGWGGDPIWDQVNPYGSSSPEPHHSGGVAGNGLPNLKSGEIYAKLLRGEVVANDQQMSDFINKTLPNLVSGVSNSSTTSIGDIVFHVAGSLDKSVIPDIQRIIMDTIDKTNKNRGIMRTVKSFSI